jgi:hypothetical protein
MKKYSYVLLLTSLVLCASELTKEVKSHQTIQKQVLQEPQKVKVKAVKNNKEQIKRKSYPRGVIETH